MQGFLAVFTKEYSLTCWFHPLLDGALNHQIDGGRNQLAVCPVASGRWDQSPLKIGDGVGLSLSQDALPSTVGYWG